MQGLIKPHIVWFSRIRLEKPGPRGPYIVGQQISESDSKMICARILYIGIKDLYY